MCNFPLIILFFCEKSLLCFSRGLYRSPPGSRAGTLAQKKPFHSCFSCLKKIEYTIISVFLSVRYCRKGEYQSGT